MKQTTLKPWTPACQHTVDHTFLLIFVYDCLMPLYVYSMPVSHIEVRIQHSNVPKVSKNLDIKQFKSRDSLLNLGKLQPSNMRLESLQGEPLLFANRQHKALPTCWGACALRNSTCDGLLNWCFQPLKNIVKYMSSSFIFTPDIAAIFIQFPCAIAFLMSSISVSGTSEHRLFTLCAARLHTVPRP